MKNAIFHPRSLFLAALLIIPAIVILVMSLGTGGTKQEGPSTEPLDITAPASNASLLKLAAKNMREAKSYSVAIDAPTLTMTIRIDFDRKANKARLVLNTPSISSEVVQVGEKVYLRSGPTMSWTLTYAHLITGTVGDMHDFWNKLSYEYVDSIGDQLGNGDPVTEAIDGVRAKHMSSDLKFLPEFGDIPGEPSERAGTFHLWISIGSTPYVYQLRTEEMSDGQNITAIYRWSNINEDINIEAPIVVDGSEVPYPTYEIPLTPSIEVLPTPLGP